MRICPLLSFTNGLGIRVRGIGTWQIEIQVEVTVGAVSTCSLRRKLGRTFVYKAPTVGTFRTYDLLPHRINHYIVMLEL